MRAQRAAERDGDFAVLDAHPTLSCALAKDRRIPSSPVSSGRFGNALSMPATFFSESIPLRSFVMWADASYQEELRAAAMAER
jgi:hypothetical protein